MNNEIGRKITSLTLMTIMLAGGMVIAAPSMMPAAHAANANLFVSAENSQFDNYMSGPQVIEVVVIDSDINDTDQAKGEPDVTVNGKILRMVQAVDGNWYGYFADRNMALLADSTAIPSGAGLLPEGLNFGAFCGTTLSIGAGNLVDFSDTVGVAIPQLFGTPLEGAAVLALTPPTIPSATCGSLGVAPALTPLGTLENNVVRESKDPNAGGGAVGVGQIGIDANLWPFIQLYPLNPTGNVIIQYNKGGGVQTTTLTFDTVDNFASSALDRSVYTPGAEVHVTITDLWLNIDPTDEDSWTFSTSGNGGSSTTHYQVFDENGGAPGDTATNTDSDLTNTLGALMCEDNCLLITNADVQNKGFVITLQDNDDSQIRLGGVDNAAFVAIDPPVGLDDIATEIVLGGAPTPGSFVNGPVLITQGVNVVTATFTDANSPADGLTAIAELTNPVDVTTGAAAAFTTGAVTITQTDANNPLNWGTASGNLSNVPITMTEQGPNSGVFGSYDESDASNIVIVDNAARGTSAFIDYNETPVTVLVGLNFGSLNIMPIDDEWNSGEEIPVELSDNDANKNSRADEDLDLFDTSVDLIPSLKTGNPFTLAENDDSDDALQQVIFIDDVTLAVDGAGQNAIDSTPVVIASATNQQTLNMAVEKFSKRGIIDTADNANTYEALFIDLEATAGDLKKSISDPTGTSFNGFNLLNIDVRALTGNNVNVWLVEDGVVDDALIDIATPDFNDSNLILLASNVDSQSLSLLQDPVDAAADNQQNDARDAIFALSDSTDIGLLIEILTPTTVTDEAIVVDFFSFGFNNDGLEAGERIANQIIRLELEETSDNSGIFAGSLEFIMINQLNILDADTYTNLSPIADDPTFIVIEDLTDEDSIRVNYLDLGSDGVSTQIADQEEAPSHSGIVSFDLDTYKVADTVVITLEDLDLNVDSDLIEIYTTVDNGALEDVVGRNVGVIIDGVDLGRLLDVTFDDVLWTEVSTSGCVVPTGIDAGLDDTGFTLIETDKDSGRFMGDFQIPSQWCRIGATASESSTGLDLEVNYVDFRDASGETIEVGDSAGVRANTGSVSLDRTVYPVPFGVPADFGGAINESSPDGNSVFAIHLSGIDDPDTVASEDIDNVGSFLPNGDLIIHVRVNDPDFDISASGEDIISENIADVPVGPVKISVIRGANTVVLGYVGGSDTFDGVIDVGDNGRAGYYLGIDGVVNTPPVTGPNADREVFFTDVVPSTSTTATIGGKTLTVFDDGPDNILGNADDLDQLIRQFGSIDEIAPDAGIFEADITLRYTDGPADSKCPATTVYDPTTGRTVVVSALDRFDIIDPSNDDYCILQGDILQIEYTDSTDASGDVNTVTDSATFDLRNGVLQSDKSVYIIGSDMILTLIEPDLDLDNDQAETWTLDLIEWDSDAATLSMGARGGNVDSAAFDPEPTNFRETGDSTGIFQIVIEIPQELDGDGLERGEEIVLEYTDWGPSGSDFVGDEDEDVNVTLFTSNFGATVELDQKVYSWTDKVFITVVAPDHNFDGDLIDEIGNSEVDPIKVSTRGFDIDNYKLVETGTDTGIFTGEVILTGFEHDADGDGTFDTNPRTEGSGPTDGFLETDDDDGLTVSFEFSEDETVVGSSLIRWNIGEVQWLEASYPASGTGVVRVIDPDMNLDPEAVDNYDVDVWSDSDAGGIDLTVTETNEATGIFEGTVFFTTTDESSGHRLRVAEGDTVTAEYEDNTLPDPYTTADELDITATTLIGTVVPPLERAPAANLRTVDAFGNSLDTVSVDQQVQISADLANGQDREQSFAYLVQIQDGNGVTVSLAWITGSLSSGQSFSPALSWIPTEAGTYTATAFVWESVDNPTALSPPVSTTVNVR